ncbi:hypothetical protein HDU67_003619 [Dinochytrium kinnereticum]|nr:hypothetical protein HDU67_003619 [Dinochytrium kinnereticum]
MLPKRYRRSAYFFDVNDLEAEEVTSASFEQFRERVRIPSHLMATKGHQDRARSMHLKLDADPYSRRTSAVLKSHSKIVGIDLGEESDVESVKSLDDADLEARRRHWWLQRQQKMDFQRHRRTGGLSRDGSNFASFLSTYGFRKSTFENSDRSNHMQLYQVAESSSADYIGLSDDAPLASQQFSKTWENLHPKVVDALVKAERESVFCKTRSMVYSKALSVEVTTDTVSNCASPLSGNDARDPIEMRPSTIVWDPIPKEKVEGSEREKGEERRSRMNYLDWALKRMSIWNGPHDVFGLDLYSPAVGVRDMDSSESLRIQSPGEPRDVSEDDILPVRPSLALSQPLSKASSESHNIDRLADCGVHEFASENHVNGSFHVAERERDGSFHPTIQSAEKDHRKPESTSESSESKYSYAPSELYIGSQSVLHMPSLPRGGGKSMWPKSHQSFQHEGDSVSEQSVDAAAAIKARVLKPPFHPQTNGTSNSFLISNEDESKRTVSSLPRQMNISNANDFIRSASIKSLEVRKFAEESIASAKEIRSRTLERYTGANSLKRGQTGSNVGSKSPVTTLPRSVSERKSSVEGKNSNSVLGARADTGGVPIESSKGEGMPSSPLTTSALAPHHRKSFEDASIKSLKAGSFSSLEGTEVSHEHDDELRIGGQPRTMDLANAVIIGDSDQVLNLLDEREGGPCTDISKLGNDALNSGGLTLLHLAAAGGHLDTVVLLLDRNAEVDAVDSIKETALLKAAFHGHDQVVSVMLERNAQINHQSDEGFSALHKACFEGHTKAVQVLIAKGADINLQSQDGVSPLMLASLGAFSDIIRMLLAAGASPNLLDSTDCCAFLWATKKRNIFICEMLLDAEKKSGPQFENVKSSDLIKPSVKAHRHNVAFDLVYEIERSTDSSPTTFSPWNSNGGEDQGTWLEPSTGLSRRPDQVSLPATEPWNPTSDWMVDFSHPSCDKVLGWQYAFNIQDEEADWKPSLSDIASNGKSLTRRRRWVRFRSIASKQTAAAETKDKFHCQVVSSDYTALAAIIMRGCEGEGEETGMGRCEKAVKVLLEGALWDKKSDRRASAIRTALLYLENFNAIELGTNAKGKEHASVADASKWKEDLLLKIGWRLSGETLEPIVITSIDRAVLQFCLIIHLRQVSYTTCPSFLTIHYNAVASASTRRDSNASGSSSRVSAFPSSSSPSVKITMPSWQPDSTAQACSQCSKRFSIFVRRHHCRWCGKVFCDNCTSRRWNLPSSSSFSLSRVCNICFSHLSRSRNATAPPQRNITRPAQATLPLAVNSEPVNESLLHPVQGLNWRRDSAPDLVALPQTAAINFTTLANSLATATSSALHQISTSLSSLDEQLSKHFESSDHLHAQPPVHRHRRASSASIYSSQGSLRGGREPIGELVRENVYEETIDDGTMSECPVCGTQLRTLESEAERETHVASCLSLGTGGGTVRGTRYISIDDWFVRNPMCPVHYTF